ncbi:MAG: protein-glutamate O-methyltransferase CheR [Magnetococcales bacterium]|nr:protein-glutamate O-methyltransferase CheR [Magnetococcales bacterium]
MHSTRSPSMDVWPPERVAEWHALVQDRSGLSFDRNRISKLLEGVEDRMRFLGVTTLGAYRQYLEQEPGEFEALISLLTVNETYFFRGNEELSLFAEFLLPEFFHALYQKGQGHRPVSIISAGCSSGEEPYSITMALLERHGHGIPFQVYGGDVDTQALSIARAGCYGENAFRSFDAGMRGRYFVQESAGKAQLMPQVREKVSFFTLNLMSDPYPLCMHGADFIFYRNVSIYFDEKIKKNIFSRLVAHLSPGGCLFFSPAEIFFHNQVDVRPPTVQLEDRQGRFFFRKQDPYGLRVPLPTAAKGKGQTAVAGVVGPSVKGGEGDRAAERAQPVAAIAPLASGLERLVEEGVEREKSKKRLAKWVRLAHEKRYKKLLSQLDLCLQEEPDHPQATVLKAAVLLAVGEEKMGLDMAKALCRRLLARDALHFEALVLLSIALRREGVEPTTQMAHLKAAVFLRPSCWLPHFYLAQTYELLGEIEMASREYQVVIYQLGQAGGWSEHGLTFLPLSLSADELVHFCHFRLKQMRSS